MRLFTLLLLTLLCTCVRAQNVTPITIAARAGETLTYELNLDQGQPLTTLAWAWDGQNACFVELRAKYFTGNHVFLRTEIPKYSTMVIRLVPKDKRQNMSLYAYSGGHGALPPDLHGCVSCEADFQQDRPSISRPKIDHTRSVELRAVTRPYPVTIGVAGASGLAGGDFVIEVTVTKNR
jgi:hypothetical protein